jgi:ABC-type branched-subunit amino acid transport system substrate-binding protein
VSEAEGQMKLMRAAGLEIVLDRSLPITTLSYDSAARSVANSGADYLLFVHEQGASAAMARALANIGYQVRFPDYIVAYGSNFIDLAGPAAEGATSWLYTLPIEDAGTNAELDTFLEWMERTAPSATLDTFASVAWAAAKAFLDILEAVPGPISRDALLAQAAATPSFDAGGMVGRVRLSAKVSEGCLIGVVARGGAWRRLTPAQGFLC